MEGVGGWVGVACGVGGGGSDVWVIRGDVVGVREGERGMGVG
jgi:hypothetical protein